MFDVWPTIEGMSNTFTSLFSILNTITIKVGTFGSFTLAEILLAGVVLTFIFGLMKVLASRGADAGRFFE